MPARDDIILYYSKRFVVKEPVVDPPNKPTQIGLTQVTIATPTAQPND